MKFTDMISSMDVIFARKSFFSLMKEILKGEIIMIASKWRRLEFIPSEEDSNIRELKVIACEEYKCQKLHA